MSRGRETCRDNGKGLTKETVKGKKSGQREVGKFNLHLEREEGI